MVAETACPGVQDNTTSREFSPCEVGSEGTESLEKWRMLCNMMGGIRRKLGHKVVV